MSSNDALMHLDRYMNLHLLIHERLPHYIQSGINVKEGRLIFESPFEFKLVLTLKSPTENPRWQLLELDLLIQCDRKKYAGNAQLLPITLAIPSCLPDHQLDMLKLSCQQLLDQHANETPITKLFGFLSNVNYLDMLGHASLCYQLEMLYFQVIHCYINHSRIF
jgi:hypothetical protein